MKNKIISRITQLVFLCVILISCEENEIAGTPTSTIIPNANFSIKADKFQAGQKIEFIQPRKTKHRQI